MRNQNSIKVEWRTFMRKLRPIALMLVIVMVCFAFTSCQTTFNGLNEGATIVMHVVGAPQDMGNFGLGGSGRGSAAPVVPTPTAAPAPIPTAAPVTNAPAEETPTQAAPSGETTTQAPSGETTTAAPAGDGTPSTKEEIVNLFTTAYNKAMAEAKGATHVKTSPTNNPPIVETGKLSSIASGLMGSFLKESSPNTEIPVTDVPPKGLSTSPLTAAIVAEATCTENAGVYEVMIKLNCTEENPDVNPPAGGGKAGTIVNVLETSTITDAVGNVVKFENPKNTYFDTTVKAKIEKDSGKLLELQAICPSILSFDKVTAVVLSVENARIGLTYDDTYKINW
jgi:hypothetical protein